MSSPETTTVFAGVDGQTTAALPAWYRERTEVDDPVSFAEAIRSLPRAIETTVAYNNPYTGEWVETDRFNALVEPSRLQNPTTYSRNADPLFYIPTDSYSIINPPDVYRPLERVLREHSLGDDLSGEVVFGEIRQYRGSGEVHMDILFDGLSVALPDRSDPILSV